MKKLQRSCARMVVAGLAMLSTTGLQAMVSSVEGTVTSVLVVGDDSFGGCMASLSVSPATKLAGCAPNWVTFDCAGVLPTTDVVRAYRMLDQAQLAYATKGPVWVQFTDRSTVNGYCLATRIDVI